MVAQVIATYPTKTEADVVVARLESEGIRARAVTDSAGGLEPQLDLIRGVRVVVSAGDIAEAAGILDVEIPEPPPPLTEGQERVVSTLQWIAYLVAGFGLATVVWRILTG